MIICNTKSMVYDLVIFLQTSACRAEGLHRDLKQRLGYGVNGTVEITDDYLFKDIEREVESDGR